MDPVLTRCPASKASTVQTASDVFLPQIQVEKKPDLHTLTIIVQIESDLQVQDRSQILSQREVGSPSVLSVRPAHFPTMMSYLRLGHR